MNKCKCMDKQRRFESLKKCLAVCLLLVFIPLGIKAQNAKQVSQTANERTQILEGYTIRGVVNDADGNPLPGASVRFKKKTLSVQLPMPTDNSKWRYLVVSPDLPYLSLV